MDISPGLIGLYWLAASFAVAVLWSATATLVKRAGRTAALAAHHAGRQACPCGGHQ